MPFFLVTADRIVLPSDMRTNLHTKFDPAIGVRRLISARSQFAVDLAKYDCMAWALKQEVEQAS